MKRNNDIAREDAKPSFIGVTSAYERKFPNEHEKILDRSLLIEKNRAVASLLPKSVPKKVRQKLHTCCAILSSNDPRNLLPDFYCMQPMLCSFCRSVLTQKRVAQIKEACELFADQICCTELIAHRFIVQPDMRFLSFQHGKTSLAIALEIISEFKKLLHTAHGNRNIGQYLAGRIAGKNRIERKQKVWGPTLNVLHLVPVEAKEFISQPVAHLHLTIVTARQARAKSVSAQIYHIWERAKANAGYSYKPNQREVKRWRPSRETRPYAPADVRFGHFFPYDWSCHASEEIENHFAYLSEPIKKKFSAEAIVAVQRLMHTHNLDIKSMRQQLGMQKVARARMPSIFDGERLQHKYVAKYTSLGDWHFFQRNDAEPKKS